MDKIIKINNRNYRIKRTLRAVLDYEIENKKQTVDTLNDNIKMFYFILKNANRKKTDEYDRFTLGYEAFLDALDEDETILNALTEGIEPEPEPEPEDKKK